MAPRARPTEAHLRFRQQLGLPTDRPVVLSGHQITLWHAGILAKVFAALAWARRMGGAAAWVALDHDPEDFSTLRVPVREAGGPLAARVIPLAPKALANNLEAGIPPVHLPTFEPSRSAVPSLALRELESRIAHIRDTLERARSASTTAAEQVTRATHDLCPGGLPTTVFSSRLADTDFFASMVSKMREDPRACHECYNAALAAAPEARLTPLAAPGGRLELPLWTFESATGVRRRVYADMLQPGARLRLAPRALLLSGVLRLGACDVFIHGLGGGATDEPGAGGYDRATEAWLKAWLGEPLAPAVAATATLHLPLADGPEITPAQAAQASWRAHATPHSPAMVGDADRARRKTELVAQVASAPRRSPQRREVFQALQALLLEHRASHSAEVVAARQAAALARRRLAERGVAFDRTWAFPLHAPEALEALRARIEAALS